MTGTWVHPSGREGEGLIIEVRPYNVDPFEGSNWVDHLCVTIPDGANLQFPGGAIMAENNTLSEVKALFR